MACHIVVVGSLNMDLVVRAPRHPEAGETILGSSFDTYPGGKGANQAVAAARMGAAVKMIGASAQTHLARPCAAVLHGRGRRPPRAWHR